MELGQLKGLLWQLQTLFSTINVHLLQAENVLNYDKFVFIYSYSRNSNACSSKLMVDNSKGNFCDICIDI